MTWSLNSTLTATTYQAAYRELIDNVISTLPSWDVATPASPTNYRNMRYNMGANNIFDAGYMYFNYSDSFYINPMQNNNSAATWQDNTNATNNGMTVSNLNGTFKVWTSSLLQDSFILTVNGYIAWGWIECQKWMAQGNSVWSTTTYDMDVSTYLGFSNAVTNVHGRPYGVPAQNALVAQYDMDFSYSSPYFDGLGLQGKVIQGFSLGAAYSNGKAQPMGRFNTSDFLLHLGSTNNASNFNGQVLQKVTDGTNWWFRTNSDLVQTGFLLPCGTTEPVLI